MPRFRTAKRGLLLLGLILVCLAVPAAAGGQTKAGVSVDPVVTGTLGANGWYVSNVTVAWDIAPPGYSVNGCFVGTISHEGHTHIACTVTWTDPAVSLTYQLDIYIDKTPPTVGAVTGKHGNRSVSLAWTASADTTLCRVTRTGGPGNHTKVVYQGRANAFLDKGLRTAAKYQYTVIAYDKAGNTATNTLTVTATGRLLNPVPGQRVSSPPHLAWLAAKGASYYNVQLIRGNRILSAWPARTNLRLRGGWTFHGHRYRLRPGVYRWYVWPGFGKRKQAHYGRLLGSNSFVYTR